MKEKDIEAKLAREVKKLGGTAYKFVSPGNDGVPDRIVVLPDRNPVFVELKSETGRLSRLQTVQVERLQKLGQTVRVVRGTSGLETFLKQCREMMRDGI